MAATRDPSQKITFVYSNLYKIYKDGKKAAHAAPEAPATSELPGLTRVIKTGDARVSEYSPLALLGKRVATPAPLRDVQDQRALKLLQDTRTAQKAQVTLEGLRNNLTALQGLQAKIKFFLGELEEMSAQAKRPAFSIDDDE